MEKIPVTREGVEAFARAHNVKFSFGITEEEALRVIPNPFDRMTNIVGMKDTYRRLHNRVNGIGGARVRLVAIVGRDGWNDAAYAVALHELGHVLSPTQLDHVSGVYRISDELDAWAWARVHAEQWSPAMEAAAQFSINSYRDALTAGEFGVTP